MNVHHGWPRCVAWIACAASVAVALTACGQPQPEPLPPLQSPIQPTNTATATLAATVPQAPPTLTQPATVSGPPPIAPTTATPLFVPTVERTPLFLPTAFGTPDTRGTSQAVVTTLTALAIPPTQPVVTRRPVGAGPSGSVSRPDATPTPLPDPSGVSLLSLSEKVYPGGAVALTIRTQPDAVCALQIARTQSDGSIKTDPVPGGAARQAGGDGVVAWIWQVDANEPVGTLTLLVDCGSAGANRFVIEVAQ